MLLSNLYLLLGKTRRRYKLAKWDKTKEEDAQDTNMTEAPSDSAIYSMPIDLAINTLYYVNIVQYYVAGNLWMFGESM